jgi:fatty acid synthase
MLQKMDPQLYKLLEVSYEAWMDSGIDVRSLRDSNRVGVYTGICGSEVRRFTIWTAC